MPDLNFNPSEWSIYGKLRGYFLKSVFPKFQTNHLCMGIYIHTCFLHWAKKVILAKWRKPQWKHRHAHIVHIHTMRSPKNQEIPSHIYQAAAFTVYNTFYKRSVHTIQVHFIPSQLKKLHK